MQAAYLDFYDYTCWMQSDFDTAYHNLKSLNKIEDYDAVLVNIYQRLLKPAAQYHIYTDDPQGHANAIFINESPQEKKVEEENFVSTNPT